MMYSKKAQSILEYMIVLTTVVAAISYAARNHIAPAVEEIFNSAATTMESAASRLPR